MRFACQSCGKAYNLPEERIADKSNVKLKCRVCGAIVEVKKQGELVAQLLDEADAKRMVRVSEAPAPLTSITPEDDDDPEGATVSISESSINEGGPLELEYPVLPGAAPTGFAPSAGAPAAVPPPLAAAGAGGQRLDSANVAPPLPPPPLSPSSLPPPPLHSEAGPSHANGAGNSVVTSVAEVTGNGTSAGNGAGGFFPDAPEGLTPELKAPVAAALAVSAGGHAPGASLPAASLPAASLPAAHSPAPAAVSPELADFPLEPSEQAKDPMFKFKMLAAFATGVLIDRIVSGLFQ